MVTAKRCVSSLKMLCQAFPAAAYTRCLFVGLSAFVSVFSN